MKYPGRYIRKGEADKELVSIIKARLAIAIPDAVELLKGKIFDRNMVAAVRMFQARNTDANGRTLEIMVSFFE